MRPRTNKSGPMKAAANGVWHDDQFGFFAVGGLQCTWLRWLSGKFSVQRRAPPSYFSLKIGPDLRVFFIADPAHSFQVVSASERSRGDNSSRQHRADTRYQS